MIANIFCPGLMWFLKHVPGRIQNSNKDSVIIKLRLDVTTVSAFLCILLVATEVRSWSKYHGCNKMSKLFLLDMSQKL